MGRSGRDDHRDRDRRQWPDDEPHTSAHRVFLIPEAQRQQVAKCLRYIDEARRALEQQQNPDNREIIRELRASADRIFDVLGDLEEADS